MIVYESSPGEFSPWAGEPIAGVRHPRNIVDLWPAEALARIGLYAAAIDPVPDGKQIVSSVFARVDGTVRRIDTYADLPPPPAPAAPTLADLRSEIEAMARRLDEIRALLDKA